MWISCLRWIKKIPLKLIWKDNKTYLAKNEEEKMNDDLFLKKKYQNSRSSSVNEVVQ